MARQLPDGLDVAGLALVPATIGILLCAGRNNNVVRYSLASATAPLAVADYTYDTLPPAARDAVPTEDELTAAAGTALTAVLDSDTPGAEGSAPAPSV